MRNLFVWIPQGRLGNLIFQYQAIFKISQGSVVLALDSEFFELFEIPRRFLVIPCFKRLRQRIQVYWNSFFQSLGKRKWLGTIQPGKQVVLEDYTSESPDVRWEAGRFTRVYLVRGFFQKPGDIEPLPRVKRKILQAAEIRLAHISKPNRVAIHMRFGDYSRWPVFGVPGSACLPDSYYLKALAMIQDTVPYPQFLVLSDEPDKARAILGSNGVADRMIIIEGGTASSDFALIACCSHAIISASSFSWWAAILIDNPNRILIAPKYWLGFRRKTWFPPGIESNHFVYIDPLESR